MLRDESASRSAASPLQHKLLESERVVSGRGMFVSVLRVVASFVHGMGAGGGISGGELTFLGGAGMLADCIQDRILRGRVSAEREFLAGGSEERKELNMLGEIWKCCGGGLKFSTSLHG